MEDFSAAERRSQIAQMVSEKGNVSVSDLVKQFSVTETSIRRDLNLLEDAGRLKRVHGGAVPVPGHTRTDSFSEKMNLHIKEKERIGKFAAQMIKPGEVVVFDSGTNTLQVVMNMPSALREGNAVTLVTNSIPIAREVLTWPSPNLIILGGLYLADYQATAGPQSLDQMKDLTADKVFLGADGLTITGGATTAHILMAELDRLMAERSRQIILVTESRKLGRIGFVPVIPVSRIDVLVTDSEAPSEIIEQIKEQGVKVYLV
jgi:DeoR/GlpR family transcriptional regulator of sugar metabolism